MPVHSSQTPRDLVRIQRALLSVSDKSGLVPLAHFLADRGVEILSTGGTAKTLREAGIPVVDVSDVTHFPEVMDGRVKTLHPAIHGALLARRDVPAHMQTLTEHAFKPIDLLVVNLYPFAQTVASGADAATCIENIDIGGPAMLRSAAKNHAAVTVVSDPADYERLMAEMEKTQGHTTYALRRELAAHTYARTAAYDAAITAWMQGLPAEGAAATTPLRYGENPHQSAHVVRTGDTGVAAARFLQGKELSYNNLNDASAAWELVCDFDLPACAVIKHTNPCGAALGKDAAEAFARALAGDPVSAFGGIVAFNTVVDAAAAEALTKLFLEVVLAPEVTTEAQTILAKKKNLRVLCVKKDAEGQVPMTFRSISGGYLTQQADVVRPTTDKLQAVTAATPSASQINDLIFAQTVCKHVKSNAVVLAKDGALVGVGAGQMSRVDAARIATEKAGDKAKGAVAGSDAFFPFTDGVEVLAGAGVVAVAQPGGSKGDADVIAAADKAGLVMVFTSTRHFRH
ncbi:MAG: bifunctional phosphoribosylaminoimidazolecarboxamide formyltransferase/IMP cyclohydrolase [Proteobacteria bacterium]|nr:bifunctional phosphoribosylaminoimidazolecarboxamide formyltransferase/IMP cyclohydrolase [Pseudomonadota bacterium]